jgi:hypothetical protein
VACIAEAEREGWTGETEGLRVSLAAANNKIAQADMTAARRAEAISLGIPAYRDIATKTLAAPGDPHGSKADAAAGGRCLLGAQRYAAVFCGESLTQDATTSRNPRPTRRGQPRMVPLRNQRELL